MTNPPRTAAILVAAGRGLRAGAGGPKQYRSIGGQPVIFRAMEPFCNHAQILTVQPVVNPDDAYVFDEAVRGLQYAPPVKGGTTRQASVRAGLEALAATKPDIVLIHDAALAEWAGLTVATFEGDAANMKLTTPEDFVREEARLASLLGDVRSGTGYDVHAFGDGDHLMICGVRVPHTRGFLAHSDGDVGLHALVDAILGALADGDIGSHFPPSDMKWKGAASDKFLKYAVERVAARGGRIANLEVTLICERPKIGPLRDQMRARIAEITGLDISRVAVKATTSERLGFTGREEGIAATACATIRLPWDDKGPDDKGPV
jgi:2-C-methyl-D-erythritol 2,4-cyclodiphosphate synthase